MATGSHSLFKRGRRPCSDPHLEFLDWAVPLGLELKVAQGGTVLFAPSWHVGSEDSLGQNPYCYRLGNCLSRYALSSTKFWELEIPHKQLHKEFSPATYSFNTTLSRIAPVSRGAFCAT